MLAELSKYGKECSKATDYVVSGIICVCVSLCVWCVSLCVVCVTLCGVCHCVWCVSLCVVCDWLIDLFKLQVLGQKPFFHTGVHTKITIQQHNNLYNITYITTTTYNRPSLTTTNKQITVKPNITKQQPYKTKQN